MATGKPTAAAMISAVITHFGTPSGSKVTDGDLQREPGDDRVARRHAQHAALAQSRHPASAFRFAHVGGRSYATSIRVSGERVAALVCRCTRKHFRPDLLNARGPLAYQRIVSRVSLEALEPR